MGDTSQSDPLSARVEDRIHAPGTALLKAAITTGATVAGTAINPAVGIAGGAVGAVFSDWLASEIAQPLSKRRDSWLRELHGDLSRIEKKIDYLSEDVYDEGRFSCAVVSALRIAEKTYDEEKLKLLRNAVCNIFIGVNIREDVEYIFWRYVDDLSVSHIRILCFSISPRKWMEDNNIAKLPPEHEGKGTWFRWNWDKVKELCLPDIRSEERLYKILIDDLLSKGLIESEPISVIENTLGFDRAGITDLGREFLNFVSDPKKENRNSGESK